MLTRTAQDVCSGHVGVYNCSCHETCKSTCILLFFLTVTETKDILLGLMIKMSKTYFVSYHQYTFLSLGLHWIETRIMIMNPKGSDEDPARVSIECTTKILQIAMKNYRIRPIKRTMWVEVGKIFCRRGVVKHLYNRKPQ